MAKTLILARHGRTSWNVTGRIQGHKGDSLDDEGRNQAHQLARLLRSVSLRIDHLRSSDLPRAFETASIVADHLRLEEVQVDHRLREASFGYLEGMTYDEVVLTYGHKLRSHLKDRRYPYDFTSFRGEKRDQVLARHNAVLEELRTNRSFHTILLIGHGRAFNNLLRTHWPDASDINENCEFRVVDLK